MSRLFGIAGIQMSVIPWNADATVEKMGNVITNISQSFPWVNMILFHELSVSGLVQFDAKPDPKTWQYITQSIPGPLTDKLCKLAKRSKLWLIPGSMYEKEGDAIYNTSIAISPDGEIVAKYRKIFPWYPYEAATTPGQEFCVFEIPNVGKFGIAICYDMWFPEMIRTLTWMGAEVILHPTMTPTSDRELEIVLSQANAITNQCYFVDINGVGPWGGGQSMIVDPDGRVMQKVGTQETILTEILDLDRVKMAREFGNLGLAQTLKQLRDTPIKFPQYGDHFAEGVVFKSLGELKTYKSLELENL